MLSRKLNIQSEKKFHVVVHNNSPVLKVTKDLALLAEFLGGLSSDDYELVVRKKVKKKKTKVKTDADERMIKAIQLERRYTAMKKKFYGGKKFGNTKPNSPNFEHFLKAVEIIDRNNLKIKQFLQAQVDGLKFAAKGMGTFPRIQQISTDNAEHRALDFIRSQDLPAAQLTEAEKRTELQENKKYIYLHKKIKSGTATLMEASYVRECQIVRRGEPQDLVEEYIKGLKR